MKLNNKGFAITSVLYGLLLLFVFLVGSYLLVLTSKKNRLDTISADIDDKYGFNTKIRDVDVQILSLDSYTAPYTAPYTGKYVFKVTDVNDSNYTCSSYIKKGSVITDTDTNTGTNIDIKLNNISFIESVCVEKNNEYKLQSVDLKEIWYNDLGSDS
ncbi:MAG: hypothetical protein ACI31S_06095 [Bacilli bacterium]